MRFSKDVCSHGLPGLESKAGNLGETLSRADVTFRKSGTAYVFPNSLLNVTPYPSEYPKI